ncbi:MAG: hypothetical protein AB7O52_02510 [Planctomycetota bacterium]
MRADLRAPANCSALGRRWRGLVWSCVVVVVAGQLPAVEFEQLDLRVEPLFGEFLPGRWNPVRVAVKNLSSESRRLEVSFETPGDVSPVAVLRWDVQLSGGASKEEILPCSAPGPSPYPRIVFRVVENGRQISPPEIVVFGAGVASSSRRARLLTVASGEWGPPKPMKLPTDGRARSPIWTDECLLNSPKLLPTVSESYSTIDHVCLQGVSSDDLSAPQRSALRNAVLSGLRVWISPGPAGEGNEWVLAAGEEPFVGQVVEVGAGSQVRFTRAATAERGREVRCGFEDDELVYYAYADGLGAWNRLIVAGDTRLPAAELRATRVQVPIFETTDDPWQSSRRSPDWLASLDRLFRNEVDPVSAMLLILAYLAVACPGLFFVLKRRDRLIWLLWLQPVVVLVFVGAIYGLGYLNFGVPARGHQTLVVRQAPGSSAGHAIAVRSQYNPTARQWDLSAIDGSLPVALPLGDKGDACVWNLDATKRGLVGYRLPTWSLTHFATTGGLELRGELRVRVLPPAAHETPSTEGIRFEFANGFPFEVRDPLVWFVAAGVRQSGLTEQQRRALTRRTGKPWIRFSGTLAPGETRTFSVPERAAQLAGRDLEPEDEKWDEFRSTLVADLRGVCVVDFDPAQLPGGGVPFGTEGMVSDRGVLVTMEGAP